MSMSKVRFKGQFKPRSPLWYSSHCELNETLTLQFLKAIWSYFSPISVYVYVEFALHFEIKRLD